MTNSKKDSFILYTEQIELFQELSNEQAGELIKGIFSYVKTGKHPNFSGMSKMAFITIRQILDRNAEKYEEKREKMSRNGKKGGRPPLKKMVSEDEPEIECEEQIEPQMPIVPQISAAPIFKQTKKSRSFRNKKDELPESFSEIVKTTLPEFHRKVEEYRKKKAAENSS